MNVSISFWGGSDTVTGSKYLVQYGHQQMLVDCGLFQGYKQLRLRNRVPLPLPPGRIDAVVLTHAHLDHSGYLPLLARQGFQRHVYCTPGTRDLCAILLPDSGHIQEEDAAYANRRGFSKHSPAEPLYTREDALRCLKLLHAQPFGHRFEPLPGWHATFFPAGHILGAASLLLEVDGERILFSGDLGRPDDLLMKAPARAPAADVVLVESTYGDRVHPDIGVLEELGGALKRVLARGGVAVVPVFAVGRAQLVMLAIQQLKARHEIPANLPVFLDSPMAIHTTALFEHHLGNHRLDEHQVRQLAHAATMVETPDQSRALARRHGPMVILAASGMATGGRVLHHLGLYAPDARNMILLTGYQAPGTRGDLLARGAHTVRIHGEDIPVRAEVVQMASASAHADSDQLLQWLRAMPAAPRQVYVVHGEREASDALRRRIEHELRWSALVPEHGAMFRV